ncbi:hypothetical protein [Paenibacillus sp. 1-18]|uniref:hypothetical protein n=1 Tax=Paenibacillus sp. 1-18 TaxID=1333846 RepID=UPI0004714ABE|nr:hypothetical protein [Paenibacillus sp. 1-18]
MENGIKSLYNLEEGHIILPSELIANAKLPNYEYVKFHSGLEGLTVECCCFLEDNTKVLFNYYFDENDRLLRLISDDFKNQEVLFDRKEEGEKLRNMLRNSQINVVSK